MFRSGKTGPKLSTPLLYAIQEGRIFVEIYLGEVQRLAHGPHGVLDLECSPLLKSTT